MCSFNIKVLSLPNNIKKSGTFKFSYTGDFSLDKDKASHKSVTTMKTFRRTLNNKFMNYT